MEKISPAAAVISCSATNRYGHPAKETLERLADAGTSVYRTDELGAVAIEVNNTGEIVHIEGFCGDE